MFKIFLFFLLLYSSTVSALDMGTASDACVATNNCTEANVVQALLLTQDLGVYLMACAALFFGFNLGLKIIPK